MHISSNTSLEWFRGLPSDRKQAAYQRRQSSSLPYLRSLMSGPALVMADPGIGDMILAHSLLRALKVQEPDLPIDVVATPANEAVAGLFPEVREVLVLDNRPGRFKSWLRLKMLRQVIRRRYSRVYILGPFLRDAIIPWMARIPLRIGWHGRWRYLLLTTAHPNALRPKRYLHYAQQAAALAYPIGDKNFCLLEPQLKLRAVDENSLPAEAIKMLRARKVAAICSGGVSNRTKKMWKPSNYGKVVNWLRERDYGVLLLGSAEDQEQARNIIALSSPEAIIVDLTGKCNLLASFDLLSRCSVLISDDNGIMHAGAAMGLPTLGIFGSTSPALWHPRGGCYLAPPEISQTLDAVTSTQVTNKLSSMLGHL